MTEQEKTEIERNKKALEEWFDDLDSHTKKIKEAIEFYDRVLAVQNAGPKLLTEPDIEYVSKVDDFREVARTVEEATGKNITVDLRGDEYVAFQIEGKHYAEQVHISWPSTKVVLILVKEIYELEDLKIKNEPLKRLVCPKCGSDDITYDPEFNPEALCLDCDNTWDPDS